MKLRALLASLLFAVALPLAAQPSLSRLADARVEHTANTPDVVQIRAGGKTLTLDVERHARIERELAPYADAVRSGEHRYYRGAMAGRPGTWARLARIDGAWTGAVWDGTTVWLLDPAAQHARLARMAGVPDGGTVVFAMNDINLPDGFDAHGLHAHAHGPALPSRAALAATGNLQPDGVSRFLKLTLVLDTEFQALYGGNSASVAGAVLNIVDGFYSNQVGVDVSLFHLRALAVNGPMISTDANVLLTEQFGPWVGAGNVPFAGLAHLLSGKDFNGNTVGLAYVGTTCLSGPNTRFATGIDQITFSQAFGGATVAHEIGHNFNAEHDSDGNACPASGFIMAAIINTGSPANQFSSCSLNYFNGFLTNPPQSLACLNGAPDLIFANGFQP